MSRRQLRVMLPVSKVALSRENDRVLGFHIRGGRDQPCFENEMGIYVSDVSDVGAAFSNGKLKVGDRLVSINGKNLDGVTHLKAIKTFRRFNNEIDVILGVQHGAFNFVNDNGGISMHIPKQSKKSVSTKLRRGFDYGTMIVFFAGASVVAYLLYKYKPWTHCNHNFQWF